MMMYRLQILSLSRVQSHSFSRVQSLFCSVLICIRLVQSLLYPSSDLFKFFIFKKLLNYKIVLYILLYSKFKDRTKFVPTMCACMPILLVVCICSKLWPFLGVFLLRRPIKPWRVSILYQRLLLSRYDYLWNFLHYNLLWLCLIMHKVILWVCRFLLSDLLWWLNLSHMVRKFSFAYNISDWIGLLIRLCSLCYLGWRGCIFIETLYWVSYCKPISTKLM